jgi:SpoVK/Ycf46/Vps4 family AAA+-type ATPase
MKQMCSSSSVPFTTLKGMPWWLSSFGSSSEPLTVRNESGSHASYHRYYEGVLFLTTNRVKVFDEAFQSRIHISLRYKELSLDAKRQIWAAFLRKAGMDLNNLTESEWTSISEAKINGRQIKNAVRSCKGLAASRGQPISFDHIQEVLSIVAQFERDFQVEKQAD